MSYGKNEEIVGRNQTTCGRKTLDMSTREVFVPSPHQKNLGDLANLGAVKVHGRIQKHMG